MQKTKTPPTVLYALAYLAAGFLLSGAGLAGIPIPAGVCLIAALTAKGRHPGGNALLSALFVWLGSLGSAALLWREQSCLFTVAAGLLTLACGWALRETNLPAHPLWAPASAVVPGLVVGTILLFTEPAGVRRVLGLILQLCALFLGTVAAEQVLKKPKGIPLFAALFALISGAASLYLPGRVSLGVILAAGVVFSLGENRLALPIAALSGLALDFKDVPETFAVTVLVALCLAAGAAGKWKNLRLVRYLAGLLAAAVTLVLLGKGGAPVFLAAAIGGFFALLLPPIPVSPAGEFVPDNFRLRLGYAADGLRQMTERLRDLPPVRKPEVGQIYDKATAKVCAACAKFFYCWQQEKEDTRRIFCTAAPAMTERGSARREDFPQSFAADCRHFPELLQALTRELDAAALVRKNDLRQRELQTVFLRQYAHLADFLAGGVRPIPAQRTRRYYPDCACRSHGRWRVSGDAAAGFEAHGCFYLLVCDGMGTGEEANIDSTAAVDLLKSFLLSGMEAEAALGMLGGLLILREEGGATTVDLAETDLESGICTLYKWGSGASYLKDGSTVKKIGTTSFPPGLGVDETHEAEKIRLSLSGGEVLILATDGVGGEEAEALIAGSAAVGSAELASALAACGSTEEDDRTAAVMRLRSVSSVG